MGDRRWHDTRVVFDPGTVRRDAIVRAATRLFGRYGYRKTSVDLIAREAEVAKPTVYAHFEDKDAVFVAVCGHVVDQIYAAALAARDTPDVVDRLAGILAAKFTAIFELVDSSPHALELLESQAVRAKEIVDAAEIRYAALLRAAVKAAASASELAAVGVSAAELVHLLLLAGHGASYGAITPAQHRANLDALVAALLHRRPRRAGR